MARRKINPERQRLVRLVEANGMEVEADWTIEVLRKLAEYCEEPNESPEVYSSPVRERRRAPARIEFHSPDLIQMTQGSGELETSNSHASYLAEVIHDGMGSPERNWDEWKTERKRLFPEGSTTPGADAEHQQLKAWARGASGVDARWPAHVLKILHDIQKG